MSQTNQPQTQGSSKENANTNNANNGNGKATSSNNNNNKQQYYLGNGVTKLPYIFSNQKKGAHIGYGNKSSILLPNIYTPGPGKYDPPSKDSYQIKKKFYKYKQICYFGAGRDDFSKVFFQPDYDKVNPNIYCSPSSISHSITQANVKNEIPIINHQQQVQQQRPFQSLDKKLNIPQK